MTEKERDRITQLAREGKNISRIWYEDFPQYSYGEIWMTAFSEGVRSVQGVKQMITFRLNKLLTQSPEKQANSIEEIGELINDLYFRCKENQQKLEGIRKILD